MLSSQSYVEVTRSSYEDAAEVYRAATDDYAAFPGLEDEVIRFSKCLPTGIVLDLGAGSGRDLRTLSRRADVVAGDLCFPFLKHLGPRCVQLDARATPFRSSSFVGVWCAAVLLHLTMEDATEAFREIGRVLVPDGLAEVSVKKGSRQPGFESGADLGPRWFTYFEEPQLVAIVEKAELAIDELTRRETDRATWLRVRLRRPPVSSSSSLG